MATTWEINHVINKWVPPDCLISWLRTCHDFHFIYPSPTIHRLSSNSLFRQLDCNPIGENSAEEARTEKLGKKMTREERVSTERCTLCKLPAKVYCESDKASLCWDCDAIVHGANFLVERHARSLLCGSCSRPTPWMATGSHLGQAVSPCDQCLGRKLGGINSEEVSDVSKKSDGENQVVPWGLIMTPPPPLTESFSSSCCNELDDSSPMRQQSRREIFDLNLLPEIDFSVEME